MREKTQLWISAGNREESMARVLSRAGFHEGTVLHAHRAASSALIAVFEENGWARLSDQCGALCDMLGAHDVIATADVTRAAAALDREVDELHLNPASGAPARPCDAKVAANSLDCARLLRGFVNAVLSK